VLQWTHSLPVSQSVVGSPRSRYAVVEAGRCVKIVCNDVAGDVTLPKVRPR
jgi:hypothetical protein